MLYRRKFIILVIWISLAAIQVGCVGTGTHHGREEPQSIAGTTDAQTGSELLNKQDQLVPQPLQNVLAPDLQDMSEHTGTAMATVSVCPFVPTFMRVHPLTRITSVAGDPGRTQIDMRLELDDRFGDTTKGIGFIRIRLFPRLSDNENGNHDIRLALWKPEFRDIEKNAMQFDHITRTYHFLLDVPDGVTVPAQSTLVVTLTTDTGVLNARRDLHFSPGQK